VTIITQNILFQEVDKIFLDEISFNDEGKPKLKFSLTIEENLEIKMLKIFLSQFQKFLTSSTEG
jgi:hypothetical protein